MSNQQYFGDIPCQAHEKTEKVQALFDQVSPYYDRMNDVISLGMHRLIKRDVIANLGLKAGDLVLDLATGTGDMACWMQQVLKGQLDIVQGDISPAMLVQARNRAINAGWVKSIWPCGLDAASLPLQSGSFDHVVSAFGFRNMTNQAKVLAECYRALKPGGHLAILEFSQPQRDWMKMIQSCYLDQFLPWAGRVIADDEPSYQYLGASIKRHPDASTLMNCLRDAGFVQVVHQTYMGGMVALHEGYKSC